MATKCALLTNSKAVVDELSFLPLSLWGEAEREKARKREILETDMDICLPTTGSWEWTPLPGLFLWGDQRFYFHQISLTPGVKIFFWRK